MKEKYRTYGAEQVHLVRVTKDHTVMLVHKAWALGMTPTNSRYFVYGIYTLSKNLDPILLGLGFAKQRAL